MFVYLVLFFFSSRRRHTRCALVTGVQTCALPISTIRSFAGNSRGDSRLRDIIADAPFLPVGVARTECRQAQLILFFRSHFVVGHADTFPRASTLQVAAHHRVRGRTGAGNEIKDNGLLFVSNEWFTAVS